jgi:hypothetical protein
MFSNFNCGVKIKAAMFFKNLQESDAGSKRFSRTNETQKSEAKRKWNKAKTKRKRSENCHHFRFEAK